MASTLMPDGEFGGRAGTAASGGLALLATTCCALPAALVALGAGGAMASLVSAAPWLIAISRYKEWVFLGTALSLGYSWFQFSRAGACDISAARRLRWQKVVLAASSALLAVSVFVAYALLPLTLWWEGRGTG